jgi:lysophospholipase L1-like esterase
LVNLGVSGATLGDVIAGQLPIAVDAAPRWVTLWPGPNDFRNGVALTTFAAQLEQILVALQPAAGEQRTIAVLNLPDLRALPSFAGTDRATLDARVQSWNATIATTVARHADYAVLVDLYASWSELAAHPEYISGDGFHPSTAGYRRIADLTLDAIRRVGG